MKEKKLLMVCLGNICRSPMAEGIARMFSDQLGLDWEVDSAGTADYHIGKSPDRRSINEARENGIDISKLRGRQFSVSDFDNFNHIYAMDENNMKDILSMARTKEDEEKVSLIMDALFPGQNKSVPDPYWDDDGFKDVFDMLYTAIEHIANESVSDATDL